MEADGVCPSWPAGRGQASTTTARIPEHHRPRQETCQGDKDETICLMPTDNLHLAFEDADLVAQHQELGLISGAVAEGCKGEVDEESKAGVKDEEEHGRRLIVARLGGSPLNSAGLSAPTGHWPFGQQVQHGQGQWRSW